MVSLFGAEVCVGLDDVVVCARGFDYFLVFGNVLGGWFFDVYVFVGLVGLDCG